MSKPFYHVKKRTLLAIAGCVWLVAGFNVARLGIIAYINTTFAFWQPLVSLAVFAAFGTMFYKRYFYTGLGCALAGAGILFWVMFFRFNRNSATD